ncbi:MAG: protein arginine kinase [bacterium]|nr:protein arginine kinase [bacterium]
MNFEDFISGKQRWLGENGPESEFVFSSRVRVARNLADFPFPNKATAAEKREIMDRILAAVKSVPRLRRCSVFRIEDLKEIDRQLLVERYLISRELAAKKSGSAVVIDSRGVVTIMVNEEDHIRMQALLSGLRLRECWEIISQLDDELECQLGFAFSPKYGYLTACPTNVGTGIRVSAMLHLAGVIFSKQIEQVLQAVARLHLAVRGIYGEGSESFGNLFQVSNQVTLGKTEEEIIGLLEKVVRQIVETERNARKSLLKTGADLLYDRVGRAYGILSNAHVITSREAIDLLSMLRMGVDLRIVTNLEREAINELFVLTQPAHLQKANGKELDAVSRDIERGNLLRSRLIKETQ